MKLKTLQLTAVLASMAFVLSVDAQSTFNPDVIVVPSFTGSAGVADIGAGTTYTSSSLDMTSSYIFTASRTGTFSGISGLLDFQLVNLTGLSSSPTVENIPGYFTFGSTYSFTLTSLAELPAALPVFEATGTFVDSSGNLAPTPGELTISPSGPSPSGVAFSLAAEPVPEPTTGALTAAAGGFLGLLGWQRRNRKQTR